jgi:hypothetical protein
MERVVHRTGRTQQLAVDLAYWLQRPMHERIGAVELLRRDWETAVTAGDAEPRLQRVCRVAQRRGR